MAVRAQLVVDKLICGLCADPFGGYVILWKGLCPIASTIGMREGVDGGCVVGVVVVRMILLVLSGTRVNTIIRWQSEETCLGLADDAIGVYVLDGWGEQG